MTQDIHTSGSDDAVRVASIVDESVVDGLGIRFVLFTQGCPHRCPGCHNPTTHDYDGGQLMTDDFLEGLMKRNPLLDGITLSGGEPFVQPAPLAALCRRVHARGLDVWCYTGYTLEQLTERARQEPAVAALLAETDVLIDGPFVEEKKDLTLCFRGSSNQRVIDLNATRAAGAVVLLPVDVRS